MEKSETPQKFNFIFLLLHPMRALRFLRVLTQERDELQKKLDKALTFVESLTKQTRQQRDKLDELRDTNKRLDVFMQELQKVEDMKRNYENRIKLLQIKIDNLIAENVLLEPGELDEPTKILLTPNQTDHKPKKEVKTRRRYNPHDTDDSDWLQHI